MNVARYWARSSIAAKDPSGYEWHHTLIRGSDISKSDARRRVEAACSNLTQQISAGETVWTYEYERRLRPEPIEREWFSPEGTRTAAITINRHAIPVLNVSSLVIVDVDVLGLVHTYYSSRRGFFRDTIARLFSKKNDAGVKIEMRDEARYIELLRNWLSQSDTRSARLYRTAAGLRYILPNLPLEPNSEAAQSLMTDLDADPRYALLCKHQRSYRARLAPKPWRIGCKTPLVRTESDPEAHKAHPAYAEYLRISEQFAVCSLIEHLGPEAADEQSRELIRTHDELCKATSGLPLA